MWQQHSKCSLLLWHQYCAAMMGWKVIADIVMLRREVVGLGLAFQPDQLCLFGRLVHVVRDRTHVVEELGIHRPLPILLPDGGANECRAAFGDCLLKGEALPACDDIAKALVWRAVFVGGGGGGCKPAFVSESALMNSGRTTMPSGH